MATRDVKGQFVKKDEATVGVSEELETDPRDARIAELEALLAAGATTLPAGTEVEEVPRKERPTLRLQSKYRNHTYMIKPPRRIFHQGLGIEPVPGVFVKFEGPQRIFDSVHAAETYGWDEETREQVEKKLVQDPAFMVDFYPAPLSTLPDELLELARTKPPVARRLCQAFGYDNQGTFSQCPKDAAAGQLWCDDHDPDVTRIKRGGGTTAG